MGDKCIISPTYSIVQGVVNISIDILLLMLPVLKIRQLQISQAHKFGISGIFLLGGM